MLLKLQRNCVSWKDFWKIL